MESDITQGDHRRSRDRYPLSVLAAASVFPRFTTDESSDLNTNERSTLFFLSANLLFIAVVCKPVDTHHAHGVFLFMGKKMEHVYERKISFNF